MGDKNPWMAHWSIERRQDQSLFLGEPSGCNVENRLEERKAHDRFFKYVGGRSDRIWWLNYLDGKREEGNSTVTLRFSAGQAGDRGEMGSGEGAVGDFCSLLFPSVPEPSAREHGGFRGGSHVMGKDPDNDAALAQLSCCCYLTLCDSSSWGWKQ